MSKTDMLSEELRELLIAIKSGKEYTAEELAIKTKARVSVNAINNRLERLRDMDILKRVREGRFWKYSLSK